MAFFSYKSSSSLPTKQEETGLGSRIEKKRIQQILRTIKRKLFFYHSSTKIKLEKRTKSKLCAALQAVCLPRGPGFLQGNRLTMWVGHLGAYLPEVLGSFVKVLFPAAAAFGSNKGPATKNLIFAHLLGSPISHTLVHIFALFCE